MKLKDTTELADTLGVSKSFLDQARLKGNGPQFVKLGRSIRYRDEDVTAWLAQRVASSTSQQAA
jgi:excisionase family DNA binding protein